MISEELREAKAGTSFRVELPTNLLPTDGLHDFAPLQYADDEHGFYLIGLSEPKDEMEAMQLRYSLEDYAWFVERSVVQSLDTFNVSQHEQLIMNGLNAETTDLYGALGSLEMPLEVWFRLCVIESPTHFHQLIAWTSREQHTLYKDAMMAIECSFQELGNPEAEEGQQGGAEANVGG